MRFKVRTAAFAALGLAAAIVVAAVIVNQLPGNGPDTPAGAGSPPGTASSAPQAGEPDAPKTPSPSGTPAPGPPSSGQEQQPRVNTGAPYVLPPSTNQTPLIHSPLPTSASARGSIVKGFPISVISLAQKSTVAFTSVTSETTRLQVGLDATSTMTPTEVLDYYRSAFGSLGLKASPSPAVEGSTALAFVRGANNVTVTVSPSGSGSQYTVYGVLSTET